MAEHHLVPSGDTNLGRGIGGRRYPRVCSGSWVEGVGDEELLTLVVDLRAEFGRLPTPGEFGKVNRASEFRIPGHVLLP